MSSLAAARADGYYLPPEYDPQKHGGLNKYRGSHGALGDRARKLDQGILIIRFEMPFNVWCDGCGHLIGKGVRFNAEKKQIGNYFSTKIWSFSMKSACCKTRIEVQTDPKAGEYNIVAGARRKVTAYDAEDAGTVELPDPADRSRNVEADDPLFKVEAAEMGRRAAQERRAALAALHAGSEARHRRDYKMNKALRRRLRAVRKDDQARDVRRRELGLPDHVKLLPETDADREEAAAVTFGGGSSGAARRPARGGSAGPSTAVRTGGIFSAGAVAAAARLAGAKRRSNAERAAEAAKRARLEGAASVRGGGFSA